MDLSIHKSIFPLYLYFLLFYLSTLHCSICLLEKCRYYTIYLSFYLILHYINHNLLSVRNVHRPINPQIYLSKDRRIRYNSIFFYISIFSSIPSLHLAFFYLSVGNLSTFLEFSPKGKHSLCAGACTSKRN